MVLNVPGAISALFASFTGLAGVRSFALTVQELESLQNRDVEAALVEIEEYRFLLRRKLLYSEIFVLLFNALFLVSCHCSVQAESAATAEHGGSWRPLREAKIYFPAIKR